MIDQSQTRLSTQNQDTPNSPYNPLVTGVVVVYKDPEDPEKSENFLGLFHRLIYRLIGGVGFVNKCNKMINIGFTFKQTCDKIVSFPVDWRDTILAHFFDLSIALKYD